MAAVSAVVGRRLHFYAVIRIVVPAVFGTIEGPIARSEFDAAIVCVICELYRKNRLSESVRILPAGTVSMLGDGGLLDRDDIRARSRSLKDISPVVFAAGNPVGVAANRISACRKIRKGVLPGRAVPSTGPPGDYVME